MPADVDASVPFRWRSAACSLESTAERESHLPRIRYSWVGWLTSVRVVEALYRRENIDDTEGGKG